VAVERSEGQIATWLTNIYGTPEMQEADAYYVDRLVKFLLWSKGGFKVTICGDETVANSVKKSYSTNGSRAFDKEFMERVYETAFVVESVPYENRPKEYQKSEAIGRHMNGCRIGFDAGGSDRKVSAVIDGEAVYSEEVVWFPKTNPDPDYHYNGIVEA
ncbi:MAG: ROK family protein, partial [Oscillospiraceae bacterium]